MKDKKKLKRAKKALELACSRLANIDSICPTEKHLKNQDCLGICTKCWKIYFYKLADSKGKNK